MNSWFRTNRFLRLWLPLGIALVLIISLVVSLLPHRITNIISVDEQHTWQEGAAPPRREVVWEPPKPVDLPPRPPELKESLIRPHFAERESVLYFTLRDADGRADIYAARLVDNKWQPPEQVAELNTEANDIGPVISTDGTRLYLFSDRVGGVGGFDLYVSQSTPDGWSEPQNLGPQINTLGNEYGPAVSPDGLSLYFSSNRNIRMHKRAAEFDPDAPPQWTETLRAQQVQVQYDLYVAKRESKADPFSPAETVADVNRPNSNEGTPYVSASGVFLYFTSDRMFRNGERANYDLYRGRIRGDRVTDIENLGTGVNTPANELEPALSPDGFHMVFSSDRISKDEEDEPEKSRKDELYALYTSTATEVFEEPAWTQSRLPLVLQYWWWFVLALLIAALAAALIWYLRQVSLRRAPVPGVFIIALLFHFLLATSMFFVGLGGDFVQAIKEKLQEVIAMDYAGSNLHQSHQPGQQAYEKVSDLTSVETVEPTDVIRQVMEVSRVPVPTDEVVPMLPTQLDRDLPPDQVVFVPPKAPMEIRRPIQLARRTPIDLTQLTESEPVKIEMTGEAVPQQQQPLKTTDVDVNRTQPVTQVASLTPLPRNPSLPARMQPNREEVAVEPVENTPITSEPVKATPLPRNMTQQVEPIESPLVKTESVAPTEPSNVPQPIAPNTPIELPRNTLTKNIDAPAELPRVPMIDPNVKVASANLPAEQTDQPQQPVSSQKPIALARTSRVDEQLIDPTNVAIDPKFKVTASLSDDDVINKIRPDVTVGQQNTARSVTQSVETKQVPVNLDQQPSKESVAPNRPDQLAKVDFERVLNNPLQNRTKPPESNLDVDIPMVKSDQVGDATSSPKSLTTVKKEIDIKRQDDLSPQMQKVVQARAANLPNRLQSETKNTQRENESTAYDQVASTKTTSRVSRVSVTGDVESVKVSVNSPAPSPASSSEENKVAGVEVGVNRPDAQIVRSNVKTASEIGGTTDPRSSLVVVGSLSKEQVDVPPSFSTIRSRLVRRPARAPETAYAGDMIGLQAMFRLRQGEAKEILLKAYGGDDKTLQAVRRGLTWIEQHQFEDGHWSLHQFNQCCKGHNKCNGHGSSNADAAATGFALLPFLGDGHTHQVGNHQATIQRGLDWMLKQQKENGDLTTGKGGNTHMYAHAIATIALCEAYGMSKDERLREPSERAIKFIVDAQHKPSGGWRYHPNQSADTSVVGWQVMALKSGQMAGLQVPSETLELVHKWLNSVEGKGNNRGRYGYTNASPNITMTAEALLCREYLGVSQDDPSLIAGANYLLKNLPQKGKDTTYYWYYGTQTVFHLQGDYWKQWHDALEDTLLGTQHTSGPLSGTWDPKDNWEKSGGRIYSTSLRLLMLEAPYRHLPLYQVTGQN